MGKVILVLSDGLRYDAAVAGMGFLGHLVETRQASLYQVQGELPSMSRPMYETIHTGLVASEHGIVSNSITRRSNKPNIFELASKAGRITAAAVTGPASGPRPASSMPQTSMRDRSAGRVRAQAARAARLGRGRGSP